MTIAIPRNLTEVNHHLHDPLLKNSFFIMLTSFSSAGNGSIFSDARSQTLPRRGCWYRDRADLFDGAAGAAVHVRAGFLDHPFLPGSR